MWDSIEDPSKRREIRYGNNIYVLFRALLHCKRFYGQDSLWVAIARGFNTSPTIVRVAAEILTQARREQRSKPIKDIPDTARAADEWIDFLDSYDPRLRSLSDPEVYNVSEAFFKAQEKKHLNAARVPTNPRQRPLYITNVDRRSPERSLDGGGAPIQSPPVQLENLRESDRHRGRSPPLRRKRSASPEEGVSSKSRRTDFDTRRDPRLEPEKHGALDKLPTIQPTRSPPRVNQPRAAQPARPVEPVQPVQSTPHPAGPEGNKPLAKSPGLSARVPQVVPQQTTPANSGVAPGEPARSKLSSQPVSQTPSSIRKEESSPKAPAPPDVDDASALKARIVSLEKQLEEAKSKQTKPTPVLSSPLPSQLGEDMVALKKEMATATNAVSTIMESMHDIVDNLQSLQGEISALVAEQKDLKTTLPQSISSSTDGTKNPSFDLNAILQPLQNLDNTVNALRAEVSELKRNQAALSAPTSQTTGNDAKQLETLLQSHTARLDKLSQQMAALQQAQQQQAQRHSPQPQGQPQNLRQAMAAAERDLKHHLATVQTLYHRGGAGRAVTDRTADLLVTLSEAVRAAQAGQAGI
ncbi:uncharacterized protein P884DRAFT_207614 [Thermothelomyces heterothallicus CBS 202.75]|uniref:uncharacterized protein n=1 Tax=Thermothelomyces heterothallicus CBS 202.75 TaxID=1149848 RepID=UPI0037441A23